MSFYTGRYNATHGATYNNIPLRVDEKTIGDYLRPLGYRVALVGKTHFKADDEAMARLGIDPNVDPGLLVAQCGFEPYERDDGLHPDESPHPDLAYNRWLRERGYPGDNPWHEWANSVEGEEGEALSGWSMRHAGRPARVKEEHSETAYMTDRALQFIDEAGDAPWCLHLSYIKPHWPYIAPAPYHDMYGAADILPANRSQAERSDPNPVIAAFMEHEESLNFSRDEVRDVVIPAYMGLISQFDHHVGRVIDHLAASGLTDDTIVIVTSDHGDYLGDHWLGEKDLFHEEIVRVPLIVVDPRPAADATRGTVTTTLTETIDLAPTFLDWAGGEPEPHRLEGRSLKPLIEAGVPRGVARCGVLRFRLLAAARPPQAEPAARPRARLHGPDRELEVRVLRGFPAPAVRSRDRPPRTERSRPLAGARGCSRHDGEAPLRLAALAPAQGDDQRRGDRATHRQGQGAWLSLRGMVEGRQIPPPSPPHHDDRDPRPQRTEPEPPRHP